MTGEQWTWAVNAYGDSVYRYKCRLCGDYAGNHLHHSGGAPKCAISPNGVDAEWPTLDILGLVIPSELARAPEPHRPPVDTHRDLLRFFAATPSGQCPCGTTRSECRYHRDNGKDGTT